MSSLIQECLELNQDNIEAIPIVELLDESVKKLNLQKKGGLVKSGVKDLFKANPGLVSGAAMLAISGLNEYNKYLRNTFKLHAKSAYDRKMVSSIVDALKDSGKYRIHRIKFEGGGKTWIMRRK